MPTPANSTPAASNAASHPFDIIYQAAKNKNSSPITLVLQNASINISKPGYLGTPISLLAAENDIKSVDFLLEKFSGSLPWAAYGFALQGNATEARRILGKARFPGERNLILKYMAWGFSQNENKLEADKLVRQATPAERLYTFIGLARGYSQSGNIQEALNVLKISATKDCNRLLVNLAYGYSLGKHPFIDNPLLAWATTNIDSVCILKGMARGYAEIGLSNEIVLLQAKVTAPYLQIILTSRAKGYALGGHVSEANALQHSMIHSQERQWVFKGLAQGYISGGDNAAAIQLLNNTATTSSERLATLVGCAESYVDGGYTLEEACKLLQKATTPSERTSILQKVSADYARHGYPDAKKILEQANQSEYQTVLGTLANAYVEGGYIDEARAILKQASPSQRTVILGEMASSYAQEGHIHEANQILEEATTPSERDKILGLIASGYAYKGNVIEAEKLPALASTPAHSANILHLIAVGYSYANNAINIQNLIDKTTSKLGRPAVLEGIVHGIKHGGTELPRTTALQLLSMLSDDESRLNFEQKIKKYNPEISYNISELLPKAKKINQIMTTQKLNYGQALAWLQPEMQTWLLQGAVLINQNKLPADLFLAIASFLSPVTNAEATLLANKFYVHTLNERLFSNMNLHHRLIPAWSSTSFAKNPVTQSSKESLEPQRFFQGPAAAVFSSLENTKPAIPATNVF